MGLGPTTRKWFATVSICAALGGLAINLAIAGPCLLQIRAVTGSSISNIALVFPMMSVGRLLGSVPTGIWKCPRWRGLVLGVLILMAAIMQAALPWLNHLLLMLLSFFVLGFADGYLDAESNNIIKGMWQGRDESFLVAARTSMIVGFAIGPFLSIPFVETPKPPTPTSCPGMNAALLTVYQKKCRDGVDSLDDCHLLDKLRQQHRLCTGLPALSESAGSLTAVLTSLSKLQTLYLITAAILLCLAVAVGISVWLAGEEIGFVEDTLEYEPQAKMGIEWSSATKLVVCLLLSVIAFCSNSINLSYIDFIATFVVIYLGQTARGGAYVTVLCCACAVVGSIVPIILVRYTRATWLVGICLIISTISGVLLASGAQLLVITWLGSALLGISSFAIYALMFVLADEIMGLTNRISALLVGVSAVGEIVMSFTAGRLFEPNPMNLMYILLVAFLTSDCCYISVLLVSKRQKDRNYRALNETDTAVNENGTLLH